MNEIDSEVFIIHRIGSMIDEVFGEEITIDDVKNIVKKSISHIIDYVHLITRSDNDLDLERFYYPDVAYWVIIDIKAKYVINSNPDTLDHDKQMEWDKVSSLCRSIVKMINDYFNLDHIEFANKLGFKSFSETFVKPAIVELSNCSSNDVKFILEVLKYDEV